MSINHCPLCGWGPFEEAFRSVQEICWSYFICNCCGCEYGLDDHEAYYKKWVESGCRWFSPNLKPNDWKLQDQIRYQMRPWPPSAG